MGGTVTPIKPPAPEVPAPADMMDAFAKATADLNTRTQQQGKAQQRFDQAKTELDQANAELKASTDSMKAISQAFSQSLLTYADQLVA